MRHAKTGTSIDSNECKRLESSTVRPRQNGRHFADDIFKCIFWYEKCIILIIIPLKFIPNDSIKNIPVLV